jgi:hypothetical protein
MQQEKIGRNDPCACGSGKKFKHCCARKADQRARLQDSVFKGLFLFFGPLVLLLGIGVTVGSLRGTSADDTGLDRVWSAEHSHWHAVLPDGTETEVQPGMIWVEEHGHFHRAAPPTDGLRGHETDRLDQRLDDVEAQLEP